MNKKFIKTILILLIITVVIFAIIAVLNIRRDKDSGFSSSTNYSQTIKNTTKKTETTSSGYVIGSKKNPVDDFSKNYVILLIGSIVLGILFILFYIFLNRKKEW